MFNNKVTSDISSKLTQHITKLQIAMVNLQNNEVSNFTKIKHCFYSYVHLPDNAVCL